MDFRIFSTPFSNYNPIMDDLIKVMYIKLCFQKILKKKGSTAHLCNFLLVNSTF